MDLATARRVALKYINAGLPVFPVAADCRVPMIDGGVHSATLNPDRVPRLFDRRCNIALACGPRAGVFVVDVDTKGANGWEALAALEAEHGPLPPSWRVETPSAGAHLYFRQPEARTLRNRVGFRPGLDVRTAGGSVALPPSKRAGIAYRWIAGPRDCPLADAPAWLLDVIDPPDPVRAPTKPLVIDGTERAVRYVCRIIDEECGGLARMGVNSGRNARLYVVSARLGELVGGGLLSADGAQQALERAATENGLVKEDGMRAVRATIRSGLTKGQANPQALQVSA